MLCLTRPDVIAGDARGVLRRRRRRRRDGQLRQLLDRPQRVRRSPSRPTSSTSPPPASPARSPTTTPPTAGARYVAGSIGPGTKLPSLGHIGFADLRDAYEEQAAGLLEGGVDLFLIETCIDLLQVEGGDDRPAGGRCAPPAARCRCRCRCRWRPPGGCSSAARSAPPSSSVAAMRPDVLGDQLRHRPGRDAGAPALPQSQHSPLPISVLPNAGLPSDRRRPAPTTTSRPSSSPSSTAATSTELGIARRRRLLRHDARAPPPGGRGGPRPRAGAAHPGARAERVVDLQPGARSTRS